VDPFKVHIRTYEGECGFGPSEEILCGPAEIDNVSLRTFFSKQGAAAARSCERFLSLWEDKDHQNVMTPGACVAFSPLAALPVGLLQSLDAYINDQGENVSVKTVVAAAVVWTAGGGIDVCISRLLAGKDHLTGMIMDVAATQVLNSMHRILRRLVKRESVRRFALYPVQEYLPGTGGEGLEHIPWLITMTGADNELDVSVQKSMMRPIRSRCSVMLLAEGPPDIDLADLRCEPCSGERCLYRQIGGCQLP
jgi:hypothetical protein